MKGLSDKVQETSLSMFVGEGQKRVPFSHRRHRLNGDEVIPVMEAMGFRLRQLLDVEEVNKMLHVPALSTPLRVKLARACV